MKKQFEETSERTADKLSHACATPRHTVEKTTSLMSRSEENNNIENELLNEKINANQGLIPKVNQCGRIRHRLV